jgi:ribosomal-protein-alanine N-acetyltransferase
MTQPVPSEPEIASHRNPEWRGTLPELSGDRVVVRSVQLSDAPALWSLLNTPEVRRFISPPPPTIEAFERFIARSRAMQTAGQVVCFAVVRKGCPAPIGIIQVREIERNFATAEWGFAIGSAYWGMGFFQEAAHLVLNFVFDQLQTHRLEARAVMRNGRGNRALHKIGAVHEGVLRRAFLRDGEYLDQALYSIVADDWRLARRAPQMNSASGFVH